MSAGLDANCGWCVVCDALLPPGSDSCLCPDGEGCNASEPDDDYILDEQEEA